MTSCKSGNQQRDQAGTNENRTTNKLQTNIERGARFVPRCLCPSFHNTAPPETYQPGLSYHPDTWMAVNLSHWTIRRPGQLLSRTPSGQYTANVRDKTIIIMQYTHMIYVLAQRLTLLGPCDSQIIAYYYFTYKLDAWSRYIASCRLIWYRIFTLTRVQRIYKVPLKFWRDITDKGSNNS